MFRRGPSTRRDPQRYPPEFPARGGIVGRQFIDARLDIAARDKQTIATGRDRHVDSWTGIEDIALLTALHVLHAHTSKRPDRQPSVDRDVAGDEQKCLLISIIRVVIVRPVEFIGAFWWIVGCRLWTPGDSLSGHG